MLIQCEHCGNFVGCIDEKTNKIEMCEGCSDQDFCVDVLFFDGKTVAGLCSKCAEKFYGKDLC